MEIMPIFFQGYRTFIHAAPAERLSTVSSPFMVSMFGQESTFSIEIFVCILKIDTIKKCSIIEPILTRNVHDVINLFVGMYNRLDKREQHLTEVTILYSHVFDCYVFTVSTYTVLHMFRQILFWAGVIVRVIIKIESHPFYPINFD